MFQRTLRPPSLKLPAQDKTSSSAVRSSSFSPAAAALNLQRTIGNHGVQRLLQNREQTVQGRLPLHALGPGRPLAPEPLARMESRFSRDLSHVRIHAESPAADALGAKAFASGEHIFFASGHGPSDDRLLAHEMSHVVEQAGRGASGDGMTLQFDLEEDILKELKRLPSAEEEGLSDEERKQRATVIFDRRDRLREMFGKLSGPEARMLYERLEKRKEGDLLSEKFHGILAKPTRRGLLEILERVILDAPPSLSDWCKPYTKAELSVLRDHFDSKAMFEFVDEWIAMGYGDEAAELFNEYLSRTKGDSLARKTFDDPASEIVNAFIKDQATRKRQEDLLKLVEKALPGKCPSLPLDVWTEVDIGRFLDSSVLDEGFSFGGGTIPTLPGLIAGGISPSDAGPDTRSVSGKVLMLRTVENGKTIVKLRTKLRFVVRDAIDFCPGNPGSSLAQSITIPMSRLEASGFAYDLPFEVLYDAPMIEREVGEAVVKGCFP